MGRIVSTAEHPLGHIQIAAVLGDALRRRPVAPQRGRLPDADRLLDASDRRVGHGHFTPTASAAVQSAGMAGHGQILPQPLRLRRV